MEINQLRAFNYIVMERNFSRAARRMFITQPAISMQIKSLEQEIGQTLFDRSTREIIPTEAGKILYSHTKRIFSEIENARNEIDKIQQLVRGPLIVGCSDTVSSYILPRLLSDFLNIYPDLEITVQNRPSSHIAQMVVEGTAEIGFITIPAQDNNLTVQSFFTYNDIAICSPEHELASRSRVDLKTISKYRLLLLEPGTKSRVLLDEAFTKRPCGPFMIVLLLNVIFSGGLSYRTAVLLK